VQNANLFYWSCTEDEVGLGGYGGCACKQQQLGDRKGERGHAHQQPEQSLSSPVQPCNEDEAGLTYSPPATAPVLQRLARIQFLDHGAPPQHELNSRRTVLLFDLLLQQVTRVAALLPLLSTHARARKCSITLRSWCSCQEAIPPAMKRCLAASFCA
jgi:hypothetical protein